jgi:hypothetical protein
MIRKGLEKKTYIQCYTKLECNLITVSKWINT